MRKLVGQRIMKVLVLRFFFYQREETVEERCCLYRNASSFFFLFLLSLASCEKNLSYNNCSDDDDCSGTKTDRCMEINGAHFCTVECRHSSQCPGNEKGIVWCISRDNGSSSVCALRCSSKEDCLSGQSCMPVSGQSQGVCLPGNESTKRADIGIDPKLDKGTTIPIFDKGTTKPDTVKPDATRHPCANFCPSGVWLFEVKGNHRHPDPMSVAKINYEATVEATSSITITRDYVRWRGTSKTKSVLSPHEECAASEIKYNEFLLQCEGSSKFEVRKLQFCIKYTSPSWSDRVHNVRASGIATGPQAKTIKGTIDAMVERSSGYKVSFVARCK